MNFRASSISTFKGGFLEANLAFSNSNVIYCFQCTRAEQSCSLQDPGLLLVSLEPGGTSRVL